MQQLRIKDTAGQRWKFYFTSFMQTNQVYAVLRKSYMLEISYKMHIA